jgi:hypothetical protein
MTIKDWLFISIITFLTAVGWTIYGIYHTAITTTIEPVQEDLTIPIEANIDEETLELLQQKEL